MTHPRRRLQVLTTTVGGLLIAGSMPVLASAMGGSAEPSTSRAVTPAMTTIAVTAPTRVTAKVRGRKVSRAVPRPTRLESTTPGGWAVAPRVAGRPTTKAGAVSYSILPPAGTTAYRVVAPKVAVRVTRAVHGVRVTKRVWLRAWRSRPQTVTVAASTPAPTPSQAPTPPPSDGPTLHPGYSPWVTGYYAGYHWTDGDMLAPEDVDMSAMTHFAFGRVAPGGGTLGGEPGDLRLGAVSAQEDDPGWAPDGSGRSVEDYLVDQAHAEDVEALLMVGGMGDGEGFLASSTDAVRPAFVDNLVDYLVDHDYDGLDLDWEDCLKGECGVDADETHRRLMALIADLRAEASTRARYTDDPMLITFPGYVLKPGDPDDVDEHGAAVQWRADIALAVDQYNLMSYGVGTTFNGAEWDSWFSGALTGAGEHHPLDIATSVAAYVAAGVPSERIGLGIGFFGVYWGPDITGPRQNTNTSETWENDDSSLGYGALDRMGYLHHGTRHWDVEAQSTYRTYEQYGEAGYVPPYNETHPLDSTRRPAGFLTYEDEQSIRAKGDWAAEHDLGGTILWTINYGWVPRTQTNPLLDAVKQAFLG